MTDGLFVTAFCRRLAATVTCGLLATTTAISFRPSNRWEQWILQGWRAHWRPVIAPCPIDPTTTCTWITLLHYATMYSQSLGYFFWHGCFTR